MIYTKENIKTDEDLAAYGWDLRLLQIDEDISKLEKRREEIKNYYESALESSQKSTTRIGEKSKEDS